MLESTVMPPLVLVLPLETEALLLGALTSLPDVPPDPV